MLLLPATVLWGVLLSAHCKPPGDHAATLAEGSWALGLRLYRALRNGTQPPENPLLSPLLLAASLGALSQGAGGATAQQIRGLLGAGAMTPDALAGALAGLLDELHARHNASYALHAAGALFTAKGQSPRQAFLKEAETRLRLQHATLSPGDKQGSLRALNAWAERATQGAVLEVAKEMPASPGALLVNALHFKGLWDREFDVEGIDFRRFLGSKYTKVAMMHRAGIYRHYEDLEKMVQILEMPLAGGSASMVLLLPLHVEPLSRLEGLLTQEQLTVWLGRLANRSIGVSLPRATLRSSLDLQKQLAALGMADAWDGARADFAGVTGQKGLRLAAVLHAAALELGPEGAPVQQEEELQNTRLFYADHPFVLLVRDNQTGALLLMGALDNAQGSALHDEL
ncbi:serine (or cysteine) peptidase inhibitor, clade H, member 2 [Lepisosteus oculatus]|uniref:serine (or cysteine) peptidase inhibitor, clade H, member 2 n=1 Tax=Lepisosteus oculatus TaxID=7918 RepID=UPI00371894F6